jgi:DNA-binding MarR family transcriptional regulator
MNSGYQQACEDIIALLNRSKAASLAVADEHGMTPMQLFVLYSINMRGEVAMGQLATSLHCDASNVTGLIDRLVVQKLVIRQESPQDRRTKTLSLTPKGKRMLEMLMEALPSKLGCDKLSAADCRALHTIIQKVTA